MSYFGLILFIVSMALAIFFILAGLYCIGFGYYQSLKVRATRKDTVS